MCLSRFTPRLRVRYVDVLVGLLAFGSPFLTIAQHLHEVNNALRRRPSATQSAYFGRPTPASILVLYGAKTIMYFVSLAGRQHC